MYYGFLFLLHPFLAAQSLARELSFLPWVLQNGDKNKTYLMGRLRQLHDLIHMKHLENSLAHNKCSIDFLKEQRLT